MVAKKAKVVPATAPTAETSAALADHPVLVALADAKVTSSQGHAGSWYSGLGFRFHLLAAPVSAEPGALRPSWSPSLGRGHVQDDNEKRRCLHVQCGCVGLRYAGLCSQGDTAKHGVCEVDGKVSQLCFQVFVCC